MSAPQTPLPLIVRSNEHSDERQFFVECDFMRIDQEAGKWSDQYLSFSGYFGTISPHVFAAAPELLEALKSVLTQFEIVLPSSGLTHDERQAIIDARAAIAKATGTSTP